MFRLVARVVFCIPAIIFTVETLVFQREFLDLIYGVEKVLIVLSPQDNKKRLWSLFEIYSVTTLNKVSVEFFVPTATKKRIFENKNAVNLDAITNVNTTNLMLLLILILIT